MNVVEYMNNLQEEDRTLYDSVFPFCVDLTKIIYPSNHLHNFYDDKMSEWCEEYCGDLYLFKPKSIFKTANQLSIFITHNRIWFTSRKDAVLFKCRWF